MLYCNLITWYHQCLLANYNQILRIKKCITYRFLDNWFPPMNHPIREKPHKSPKEKGNHITTILKAAVNAVEIYTNLGIGLGGNCEIGGFDLSAYYAHNYIEISIDDGEFKVQSSDVAKLGISVPIFSTGYSKYTPGSSFNMNTRNYFRYLRAGI